MKRKECKDLFIKKAEVYQSGGTRGLEESSKVLDEEIRIKFAVW